MISKKDRGILQELISLGDGDKKATRKKRKRTSFYQTFARSTRFIKAQKIKFCMQTVVITCTSIN